MMKARYVIPTIIQLTYSVYPRRIKMKAGTSEIIVSNVCHTADGIGLVDQLRIKTNNASRQTMNIARRILCCRLAIRFLAASSKVGARSRLRRKPASFCCCPGLWLTFSGRPDIDLFTFLPLSVHDAIPDPVLKEHALHLAISSIA